jgi:hypothetical protein
LRHPFNQLFRRRTPTEALAAWREASPGLEPAGFVFHMSRCGSTLLVQMLARLDSNVVLSEPGPVDTVLRARTCVPGLEEEERREWLRGIVSALGQRRSPEEVRLFIKFDCWHAREIPLVRRTFPRTPWVFLYREPVEVLASHARCPGLQMLPTMLSPNLFAMDDPSASAMLVDEYRARVLASICAEAVAAYEGVGGGMLLNYRELPDAAWSAVSDHFGVAWTEDELLRMQQATEFDAKCPTLYFQDDSSGNAAAVSDALRRAADRWVRPAYERLESLRRAR